MAFHHTNTELQPQTPISGIGIFSCNNHCSIHPIPWV